MSVKTGALACVLVIVGAAAQRGSAQDSTTVRTHVGRNVLVSASHDALWEHAEVGIAASALDPKALVACSIVFPPGTILGSMDEIPAQKTVLYESTDGGQLWHVGTMADRLRPSDPWCAFGSDDRVFFLHTLLERAPLRLGVQVHSRVRGTQRWIDHGDIVQGFSADRPYIIADASDGRFAGRTYLMAVARSLEPKESGGRGVYVWRSTDGMRSVSAAVRAYTRPENLSYMSIIPVRPAVRPNGELIVPFMTRPSSRAAGSHPRDEGKAYVTISADGGESFSDAIAVTDMHHDLQQQSLAHPSFAIDVSKQPSRGRLYLAWADTRLGQTRIFVAASQDGRTWSAPTRVDDHALDGPGGARDDFQATVAVNSEGVVGVMWYDRRDQPDNVGYDVRFAASIDGGQTFAPSVKISTASRTTPPPAPWDAKVSRVKWKEWASGGDTAGLTTDLRGTFHAAWTDNRTGHPQLWTTTISVGTARR